MTETRTRGMDPPAMNRTEDSDDEQPDQDTSAILLKPNSESTATDHNNHKRDDERVLQPLTEAATNTQTTGEPSASDTSTPTTTTPTKPKRASYSKDMLHPTQQGKVIQSGVDPIPNPYGDGKPHKPAYINKSQQLKATGYGDKIKQGAEVPRDHIAQPVDPNDSLADVYKSQRSNKFKSTGFAEQLQQGADVPRDHIVHVEDPNDKLADVYKNVNSHFKATGLGEKLKQGDDVRVLPNKDKTDQTGSLYSSISLKKAGNPEEKKVNSTTNKDAPPSIPVKLKKAETIVKDPSTLKATMPAVKLQKTTPIVKDAKAATTFQLPEEFSMAKQNLKRRTERHWYSRDIPQAQPSKKWFFQRGEWNDDGDTNTTTNNVSNAGTNTQEKKSSWFFGSSTTISKPVSQNKTPAPAIFRGSKTMLKTNKATVQHFHIPSDDAKGKNTVKLTYNKEYYDEIQRRRGLEPNKKSRRVRTWIWRLFQLLVVLPLVVAPAFYYGMHNHPEQMEQVWQKVAPHVEPVWEWTRPHVQLIRERLQPHIDLLVERVHPHMESVIESTHPYAVATVDRVCASVEDFVVPPEHEKWLGPAHGMAISSCVWTRSQLTTSKDSILPDEGADTASSPGHSTSPSQKRANPKVPPATSDNEVRNKAEQTCDCNAPPPKGLKKLLQKLPGKNKKKDCDCGPASAQKNGEL